MKSTYIENKYSNMPYLVKAVKVVFSLFGHRK